MPVCSVCFPLYSKAPRGALYICEDGRNDIFFCHIFFYSFMKPNNLPMLIYIICQCWKLFTATMSGILPTSAAWRAKRVDYAMLCFLHYTTQSPPHRPGHSPALKDTFQSRKKCKNDFEDRRRKERPQNMPSVPPVVAVGLSAALVNLSMVSIKQYIWWGVPLVTEEIQIKSSQRKQRRKS